jgi:trans-2,3-dihydro-3-hydroxyanthranilate isomerase
MRSYRYLHLDVFTSTAFEGNQLAVFPEPHGLTAELMQTIAREMNFSECTFIFPREQAGDVRMRIFTPAEELPIAGHPTIGSTFALALEGTIARGRTEFVFELGVGPTPVTMDWDAGELAFAWMTQPLPAFGPTIEDRSAVAAALGVAERDLERGLPVQVVSCGVPFVIVALASRQAVDAVQADRRALASCLSGAGIDELPVFVFTTQGDETTYSRMLAPGFGIVEDPATGSAAGPLGCYLVRNGVASMDAARAMLNAQGVAMKRPSRIHISIDSDSHRITRVRVGGQAVLVGTGEIRT